MSAVLERTIVNEYGLSRFVLHFQSVAKMDDERFFGFCQDNRDVRIEQNAKGEIIIMPPTGWETGDRNAEINLQLRIWAKKDKRGKTCDSSTGFKLPNGAKRSPDASWILKERLENFSAKQLQRFLPLCPDFVLELSSPTDSLKDLQEKMDEYIENGARLGWLLDSKNKRVFIYRPNEEIEVLKHPETISGAPVLEGFELDLREIW